MTDFIVHKLNVKLLNNINASANIASDPLNIQSISLYCIQATWESLTAINPIITLYGSNNLDEPFIQIDSFIPTGTKGGRLINVEKAGYAYVKVAYSCTSGSGKINVSINGKV
jgi:hypothetical protein